MRKLKEKKPDPSAPPATESIADVSGKLVDALSRGDKADSVSAARAGVFDSANAPKEVAMPRVMARIVEMEFEDGTDLVKEKVRLEEALDTTSKLGQQANALEQAEVNARAAFKLLIRFREMHQAWERDNATIFATSWNEASLTLQREKDKGFRSKQITDKDVEMMVATMFPDEWKSQEIKRLRAKSTEKSLEHLVEMWSSKCRSLNALVSKGR